MSEQNLEALARGYLEAFEARDLAGCMAFYLPDSVVYFGPGTYACGPAIEEWHKDRFAADLRLTQLQDVTRHGETVTANVVATSDKIRAWGLDRLEATVAITFQEDRVREARFSMREGNPLESWSD